MRESCVIATYKTLNLKIPVKSFPNVVVSYILENFLAKTFFYLSQNVFNPLPARPWLLAPVSQLEEKNLKTRGRRLCQQCCEVRSEGCESWHQRWRTSVGITLKNIISFTFIRFFLLWIRADHANTYNFMKKLIIRLGSNWHKLWTALKRLITMLFKHCFNRIHALIEISSLV